jgi:hypothetical protein
MTTNRFSVSAVIEAPPREVYAIIADYHDGHPRILPTPPFVGLDVEQGGVGSGTVIQVRMRVLGQVQSFRAVVTEPERGRVLVETTDTGYLTTFTVDPVGEGLHSHVTITTEITRSAGLMGGVEKWLVPWLLRPAYARELELLGRAVGAACHAAEAAEATAPV